VNYAVSISVLLALAACNSDGTPAPSYNNCTAVGSASVRAQFQTSSLAANQVLQNGQSPSIPFSVRGMKDQGVSEVSNEIPVTIALALNNEDELNERISEMYQPGSPRYRRYMSVEEFTERYAPTVTQISEAVSYLNDHGIKSLSVGPSGLLIHATASVGSLNEAFQTEIHRYGSGAASRFAPAYVPVMPPGLSIRAVHGMESSVELRHHAVANIDKQSGSGANSGLTPSNIHTAYNIPTSYNGAGQTIALVELDGFNQSDITAYENAFGLAANTPQVVKLAGATGAAGSNSDEVTLDIELTTAVAPGANIKVYEAPNNSQSLLSIYEAIAADTSVSEVSISWGMSEAAYTPSFLETESGVFRQMAAQGISVYAASGDQGADANGSGLSVEDPGTQPFVVAVGGTHLNSGADGSYISESTWDQSFTSATGGGISQVWGLPSWQSQVATSLNLASNTMRNVPDISLDADPSTGYSIYLNGGWTVYGGTSCATPIWAAFTALVNQNRVSSGLPALGFANPYLYAIGKAQANSPAFHDIRDGSTNGYYPAVSGYDDATGWGSMNGTNLFNQLSTEPEQSAASC
jgi:kumamolisin